MNIEKDRTRIIRRFSATKAFIEFDYAFEKAVNRQISKLNRGFIEWSIPTEVNMIMTIQSGIKPNIERAIYNYEFNS